MYAYPLNLRFKIIALAPQIYITDANGGNVVFVRQKIFNLREDVRIFQDDSKTNELFRINADRIIDFGATYRFTDSRTERPLGAIRQRGLRSIWKATYEVTDQHDQHQFQITEDNPWVKVADAVLGEIPILNFFTGYLLHPSYTAHTVQGERPVMQITKEASFFESTFRIDRLDDSIDTDDEQRLLLAFMMMLQLNRARG